MGYYVQTSGNFDKAQEIALKHNGQIVSKPEWDNIPEGKALIVTMDNGPFEAAGFAYDEAEFKSFTDPQDLRLKRYVLIDWDKACELTGYNR